MMADSGGTPALLHRLSIGCWGPPVQPREKWWVGKEKLLDAGLWQLLHPLALGSSDGSRGWQQVVLSNITASLQASRAGILSPGVKKSFYLWCRPRKSLTMSQPLSCYGLNPKGLWWVHVSSLWHHWENLKTWGGGTWLQEVGVVA